MQTFSLKFDNIENINYFPDWPCGGVNLTECPTNLPTPLDCTKIENMCTKCCNGSNYQGAFLFPPGMVQQKCFPGRNKTIPFTAILSPPHFYGAPEGVFKSMVGLNPNWEQHNTGEINIHPVKILTKEPNKIRKNLDVGLYIRCKNSYPTCGASLSRRSANVGYFFGHTFSRRKRHLWVTPPPFIPKIIRSPPLVILQIFFKKAWFFV